MKKIEFKPNMTKTELSAYIAQQLYLTLYK